MFNKLVRSCKIQNACRLLRLTLKSKTRIFRACKRTTDPASLVALWKILFQPLGVN